MEELKMLKRIKNSIALLLVFALSLGMSTSVFAAGSSNTEEAVTINLFDPDDPSLIAIIDADENARTTSRPNTNYDLDAKGTYSYSAYSNNNIMWSKYRFYTLDGEGTFRITANSTNTKYRMVVHNCRTNKDYYYRISSTSVNFYNSSISGWSSSPYFYFGVDTTATGASVSVNGIVDTY